MLSLATASVLALGRGSNNSWPVADGPRPKPIAQMLRLIRTRSRSRIPVLQFKVPTALGRIHSNPNR